MRPVRFVTVDIECQAHLRAERPDIGRNMRSSYNPGRVAGLLYLLLGLAVFRLQYIPRALLVPGNATATTNNIAAHQALSPRRGQRPASPESPRSSLCWPCIGCSKESTRITLCSW